MQDITVDELIDLAVVVSAAQRNAPVRVTTPEGAEWRGQIVAIRSSNGAQQPFTSADVVFRSEGHYVTRPIMTVLAWYQAEYVTETSDADVGHMIIDPD
jgi:hypothetical protein